MSIIPGIEARAPERTETKSGSEPPPNDLPTDFSTRASAASTSRSSPAGYLPARRPVGADLRRDREPGRHRDPERRHLREAEALSAEELLALARPFGAAVAEEEDRLATRGRRLLARGARRSAAFETSVSCAHPPRGRRERQDTSLALARHLPLSAKTNSHLCGTSARNATKFRDARSETTRVAGAGAQRGNQASGRAPLGEPRAGGAPSSEQMSQIAAATPDRTKATYFDHDLREVGQPGELPLDRREERQPVAPQVLLGAVDEHLDEEPVERGGDRGDRLHRVAIAPRGRQFGDELARLEEIRRELSLGVFAVERGIGVRGGFVAEDVANPLGGEDQGAEVLSPARLRERPDAVGRVGEVPVAGDEDGRDLVVGVARGGRADCGGVPRRTSRGPRARPRSSARAARSGTARAPRARPASS